MLKHLVDNFNLDEKEAKVYLAALSLGRSKVSEIAKKAQLNRITGYEILKRLSSRGLASGITYGNVTYFQVISPDKFAAKIKRQAEAAESLTPQLKQLEETSFKRPRVEYFQGAEGIKTVYENTLSCKEKIIYNIANPKNLINLVGNDFLDDYVKKRVRRKISVKVLVPDNLKNFKYLKNSKRVLREVKFFSSVLYPVPNEIMIYDNSAALLSFDAEIGVVIENSDIAKSMKSVWAAMWDSTRI